MTIQTLVLRGKLSPERSRLNAQLDENQNLPKRMKTNQAALAGILCGLTAGIGITAHADTFGSGANRFTMNFVTIGNAGNASDSTTGHGRLTYNYRMAVTEVSENMITLAVANGATNLGFGNWIGNEPASFRSWYQAAAFVNWLNTSTGHTAAYQLGPDNTTLTLWSPAQAWQQDGQNLFRNANAYYFLPDEDEWYKAAYYDPNRFGAGVGGYWSYATGSNSQPTAVDSSQANNTAVYNGVAARPADVLYAGGPSRYGTVGQNGNVQEWMETTEDGLNTDASGNRILRGGYWASVNTHLQRTYEPFVPPSTVGNTIGFRVASVPEPSAALLTIGGIGALLLKRRRSADRNTTRGTDALLKSREQATDREQGTDNLSAL